MIRRTFRFGIRLGLLAGIAFALFKLMQGRRSAGEYGSPSADWAPAPVPAPLDIPKPPPDPDLVQPVILEELVAKKAAERAAPPEDTPAAPAGSAARTEQAPAPAPGVDASPEPVEPVEPVAKKKATPAKRAAAKKAAASPEPAAAGPVKKIAPKKGAAKKDTAKKAATAKKAEPAAKKAAPARKATKKQQP
ncbi:MAG: hypothetical protein ACRD1D_01675 [Acidimicrobiales bacterium]